jgi:amidase
MKVRMHVRLGLLSAVALAACMRVAAAAGSYEVEDVPLSQIAADLAAGKTTSVEVTQAYIDRIRKYDGPLHAVIGIDPNALKQAAAADKRRKAHKTLGPLDGVPLLLKDNIDVVGVPTTAGSYALVDNKPAKDSEVARRLRAAGVIFLGKANLSQFANYRTTGGFNGSTVGGSTHNPYDLARTPAGSSSGSGIAAAVSFGAATIGSETSGSITGPASVNGVVGMKPTIALVSRRGIVPISLNQDTAGPMTRTVRDAAMLLNVLAGSDAGDPWSKESDQHRTDYVAALRTDALKGQRIGIMRGLSGQNETTNPVYNQAVQDLAAQGAEIVEIAETGFVDVSSEMMDVKLTREFKDDINAYLAGMPSAVKVRNLAQLIAFSDTEPHEKLHDHVRWDMAEATQGRASPDYAEILSKAETTTRDGIDRLLKQYNVVALVTLTAGPAGLIQPDGSGGARRAAAAGGSPPAPGATAYAAIAGYPHLTVPMGLVNDLPVGLSFIGPKWSEKTLLSLGYAYEQASKRRVPPTAYKKAVAAEKS